MPIANTYRFFVPPESLQGDEVLLADADLAHQMGKVLRLRPGDRVLLLDGQGSVCTVVLTELGRTAVAGQVEERAAAGGEPPVALTLYVALLRAERFEWVLQKGVELGVSAFVPVQFSRSLPAERADPRKLARWQRIIREAAEQSCRGRLPDLAEPLDFRAACARAARADLALLLWEGEAAGLRAVLAPAAARRPPPAALSLISGPEGGIAPEELTMAVEHGIIPVSLGPRILRAETAPLAATAALLYELEAYSTEQHD